MSRQKAIYFIRTRDGLVPEMRVDAEALERFKIGDRVRVTGISLPRSVRRNSLYWSVLSTVVEATGCVPSPEHLHRIVKLKLGYVTNAVLPTGEIVMIPDSTAFDEMSEAENRAFCERAFAWLSDAFGFDVVEAVKWEPPNERQT